MKYQYQFLYPGNEIVEGCIVFSGESDDTVIGEAEAFISEDFPEVVVVKMCGNLDNGVDRIIAHLKRGHETKVYQVG